MNTYRSALWHGLINGASSRDRASAAQPQSMGYTGAVAQALYWAGFQFTNAVVHGPRK